MIIACLLAGCGPGVIAGATVLSGFDAGVNLLHDGPDLFQCGHIFGHACPKDDTKTDPHRLERTPRVELGDRPWQGRTQPVAYYPQLVEIARLELASSECKSGVLAAALNPRPHLANKKAPQFPERLAVSGLATGYVSGIQPDTSPSGNGARPRPPARAAKAATM